MSHDRTMAELMSATVRRNRRSPALVDADRSMTYEEMFEWAARLANVLRANGLRQGDHVAVIAEDTVEGVAAYIGTWLAGCTVIHVNARHAPPEVRYVLEDSGAKALLYTGGLEALVDAVDGLEDLAFVSSLDDREGSAFGTALRAAPTAPPAITTQAGDRAIVGYTSGTSGRPKGAIASHRAVVLCCRVAPYAFSMPLRSRMAYSGSLSFIGSVWAQVFPHLYIGGMVRLMGRYDVDTWFAAMREDRSTFTYLPTPLIPDFVERVKAEPGVLDHLAVVFHSGSLAPRPQVEALVDAIGGRYVETYGSTEMIGSATATTPAMYTGACEATDILASAGTPIPGSEVWLEREDGSRPTTGEEGEIVICADTSVDGYWNAPEKTAETFRGGAFHSGDVGFFDEAGFLYISGRRSELIVSGGMNVYPAEVERVILADPAVRDAAVFGAPHPRWGEGVAAAIVREPGADLDAERVVEICLGQLASYKKPTKVVFVDELPVNASRKVDKRALTARYGAADGS